MEFVCLEPLRDTVEYSLEAGEDPAVDFVHLLGGDRIDGRVEVVNVAQEVAERVPDTPIHFHQVVDDVLGDADIVPVIRGGYPEPEDVRPVLLDDLLGAHRVSHGFRHFPSFAVNDEPMCQDGAERRVTPSSHTVQQGSLEPPAVLVAPLEVHFRRPTQFRARFQDRDVAGAGIEPDIHDVRFLP